MEKDKIIALYLMTSIIAFSILGIYIFLQESYYDESFAMKSLIEQELYVKYCSNPFSINPFDNYYSTLENYIINVLLMLGAWNMIDFMIAIDVFKTDNKTESELYLRKLNIKIHDRLSKCKFYTKIINSRTNKVNKKENKKR